MWRFFVLLFLASIMSSSGYSIQYGGMSDDLDDMLLPYLAPPVEKTCTDEEMKMFDAFLTGTKNAIDEKWKDYPEIDTLEQGVEEYISETIIGFRYKDVESNKARRIDGCYMFTKYCKTGKPEDNDDDEVNILPEKDRQTLYEIRAKGLEVISVQKIQTVGVTAFFTINKNDCDLYYTGPRSYTLNEPALR